MSTEVYLAVVEDPALWDTTGQVLVRYLEPDERPLDRLIDPIVAGIGETEGVWDLLLWHEATQRAFYSENTAG
ncbi:hypothetical protein HD599_000855 [Conyzicola lurida]|uniref:Uncharacterized protein n=1 Tax=Conyzicola lurida TaxID=1172621 RepID=A0A841AKQ0_9MICO|nr:hypothetical protein [Conyzicola lurida]MBB5842532.1 hypothetical protein [Conyzicola lurida]